MFYITISNGLLDAEHRKKIGSAIWEFMWLIDKVTRVDEDGWGWVLGGKPINLSDMAFGAVEDTVSRNLGKLRSEGYITTRRTPGGIVIKVAKAKKRFGKNVESHPKGFDENVESRSDKSAESLRKNVESNIRQDQKTDTVRDIAPAKASAPWSYEEKIKEMLGKGGQQRNIALFFRAKGFKYEGPKELSAAIGRWSKVAKRLTAYKDARVIATLKWLRENADFKWTLETVEKYIDEDLDKIQTSQKIVKI